MRRTKSSKSLSFEEFDYDGMQQLVDLRGMSMRALHDIMHGVLDDSLAPGVRIFVASRDINAQVTRGTSIRYVSESKDGSMRGEVASIKGTIKFRPGYDAQEKRREDWSTEDIAEYVVLPTTMSLREHHVYLSMLSEQDVGEMYQGTFVIQAHSCRFVDLVEALQNYFANSSAPHQTASTPAEQFVWLDLFCGNMPLFSASNRDLSRQTIDMKNQYLSDGLHDLIGKFENIAVFFDHWDEPAPLQRAWCVWEIYGAILSNRPIDLILASGQHDAFLEQLLDDPSEISRILMNSFDTRQAQCKKPEEKKAIDTVVSGNVPGSFVTLNSAMNAQMRSWLTELAQKAVTQARQPRRNVDFARVLYSAATLLQAQGIFEQALKDYEEALEIYRDEFGPSHRSVAAMLNNIASVHNAQGNFEEALTFYEEALEIYKTSLGPRNSDVATTLNNIASAYNEQKLFKEALEHYEEALSIIKETFGNQHPLVATTLNNIANVYDAQGMHDEALQFYEEALDIRKTTLGPRHFDVADTLNGIGLVYDSQERFSDALQFYREALDIYKESLGPRHHLVGATLHNIGAVFVEQGRLEEALACYKEALAIYKEAYGSVHPHVAVTLVTIAKIYMSERKLQTALSYLLPAEDIELSELGPCHPDTLDTQANIRLCRQ